MVRINLSNLANEQGGLELRHHLLNRWLGLHFGIEESKSTCTISFSRIRTIASIDHVVCCGGVVLGGGVVRVVVRVHVHAVVVRTVGVVTATDATSSAMTSTHLVLWACCYSSTLRTFSLLRETQGTTKKV
jgi:hypothetical protein